MVLRCFLPSRATQSHNTWTTTRVSAQLDHVIARWLEVARDPEEREWLKAFEQRYLNLGASVA